MYSVRCSRCRKPMLAGEVAVNGAKILHACPQCRREEERNVEPADDRPQTVDRSRLAPEPNKKTIPEPTRFDARRMPEWLTEAIRKLEVHLAAGRWDIAHGVLEHYRVQCQEPSDCQPTLETPLDEIGLEQRIVNGLERLGAQTVGDVLAFKPEVLAEARMFGPRTVRKIYDTLGALGFRKRR